MQFCSPISVRGRLRGVFVQACAEPRGVPEPETEALFLARVSDERRQRALLAPVRGMHLR